MKVIDASVALGMLRRTDAGLALEESLVGLEWHAPHLIDLEVLQTLRRWTFSEELDPEQTRAALDAYLSFDIVRHAHAPLIQQVWALPHNLTPYDASYLALATALRAELVTLDSGLRKLAARIIH